MAYLHASSGPEYTLQYHADARVARGPYTFQQMGGNLLDSPNSYDVVGGYVRSSKVQSVQIVYTDGAGSIITLGKNRFYMELTSVLDISCHEQVDDRRRENI